MRSLTGLNLMQYCRRFERMNLLDRYPGSAGKKGDKFPMMEARLAAAEIRSRFEGRKVVFVGLAVAEAFDAISPKSFEWRMYAPGFQGAPIPHTSPINSFWNDERNIARGREFFDQLLCGARSHAS